MTKTKHGQIIGHIKEGTLCCERCYMIGHKDGRQSAQKEYHDAKVMASKEELEFLEENYANFTWEGSQRAIKPLQKRISKLKSATTKMNSNTSSNDDEITRRREEKAK